MNDESPAPNLTRFDEEWTRTPVSNDDMYSDIPDGTYDAVIEDARVTQTASTGRPVVVWTLRIQGPQAVNRRVTKSRVITENTLPYLKEDLEKCRLVVTRLSELTSRIREVVDRPVGLDKRTKDGRANFYFRWTAAKTGGQGFTDDIPF